MLHSTLAHLRAFSRTVCNEISRQFAEKVWPALRNYTMGLILFALPVLAGLILARLFETPIGFFVPLGVAVLAAPLGVTVHAIHRTGLLSMSLDLGMFASSLLGLLTLEAKYGMSDELVLMLLVNVVFIVSIALSASRDYFFPKTAFSVGAGQLGSTMYFANAPVFSTATRVIKKQEGSVPGSVKATHSMEAKVETPKGGDSNG